MDKAFYKRKETDKILWINDAKNLDNTRFTFDKKLFIIHSEITLII